MKNTRGTKLRAERVASNPDLVVYEDAQLNVWAKDISWVRTRNTSDPSAWLLTAGPRSPLTFDGSRWKTGRRSSWQFSIGPSSY